MIDICRKTTDDLIVEEAAEAAAATAATTVATSSSSSLPIGTSNPCNKPKPGSCKDGGKDVEKVKTHAVKKERLKKFKIAEEYINFVGDIMYPKKTFGAYGFQPEKTRFPVERMTTLGYLLSPLRRRTVLEKWSPIEIALFEASLTLFGKAFHRVQKYVSLKNSLELIPSCIIIHYL